MGEKIDRAKGEVKEQAGKATGDKSLQGEGKRDQAKGNAKGAANKAKDALKDLAR